jgi:hypothetical protein
MQKVALASVSAAKESAAKEREKRAAAASLKAKLLVRCRRASEQVESDTFDSVMVSKLRELVERSKKAHAGECEKIALKAYKVAVRRSTARQKAREALLRWEKEEARDAAVSGKVKAAQEAEAAQKAMAAAAAARKAAAEEDKNMDDVPPPLDSCESSADTGSTSEQGGSGGGGGSGTEGSSGMSGGEECGGGGVRREGTTAAPSTSTPSSSSSSASAVVGWSGSTAGGRAKAASLAKAKSGALSPKAGQSSSSSSSSKGDGRGSSATHWRSGGGEGELNAPTVLADALIGLPAVIPIPAGSSADMRNSLLPVIHALSHNLNAASTELEAARAAFGSWRKESWWDPRSGSMRPKTTHSWTIEQYNLPGFSALYANKLHVPRVAASRQIMLWLLECAPGLPDDGPLCVADLGAGTCAACLGARLALRDHAGDEQIIKSFPIDVASSSERFAKAFVAMTKAELYGRAALLPEQEPWQYLRESEPGVDHLARSLLSQLKQRGERQPHLIIASFSLQYIAKGERDFFFRLLSALVTRPLLFVIIKGVGETQRPSPHVVRSVHYGLHYVVGKEKHPRVVEAHVCLILPTSHTFCLTPDATADEVARGAEEGGEEARAAGDTSAAAKKGHEAAKSGSGSSATEESPPRPPLEPEAETDAADRWIVQTFACVERRCKRHGLRTGVTLFEKGGSTGDYGEKLNY